MSENFINQEWNFKDIVENIEVVKSKTWDIIASFSSFEIKKQVNFKRQLRNNIYSLKFEEWKKDRIIECIYGYFEVEKLKEMIK